VTGIPYPPGGLGRLITQLTTNAVTEGEDCGVCAVLTTALVLSDGKVGPQHPSEDAKWVKAVRTAANNPQDAMLVRGDITQVLNSAWLADAFHDEGLPRLQATYYFDLDWDKLRSYLQHRRVIILAVDYGVLRAGKAPIGSRSYGDGHAIPLVGAEMRGPANRRRMYTNDGDPLFDGRPIPGATPGSYPRSWQEARVFDFKKAASQFGKVHPAFGRATCVVVKGGIHP
jgi:hypothetical protein